MNQRTKSNWRIWATLDTAVKTINYTKIPRLRENPHRAGVVKKIATMTPKKPNSAVRHVAKVTLSNKLFLTARMPGGEPYAKKFAKVLVEGGRANDLVGVNYTLKRRNYDFPPLVSKTRRRSIYGTSRPENHTKHVRRSLRGIGQ